MFRSKTLLSLLSLALTCFVPTGHAQQGRGTISGAVTDQTGAALKGVKVTLINTSTNTSSNAVSNGDGYYTFPPLMVGNYEVSAESAGFKKEIRRGINLQIDQSAEINLQLQIGAASESVIVTAEAPLVNTDNASLGQVIGNDFVSD